MRSSVRVSWTVACYGHALQAGTAEATSLFESSLRHHEAAGRPYDAARAELAYGEHLRRAGRRVDAREHLKRALDTFHDLAADPPAPRAARSPQRTGPSRRSTPAREQGRRPGPRP